MKPSPDLGELTAHQAAIWARVSTNAPIMMEYELREFTSYIPDYAPLSALPDRLVPAVGRESFGQLPARAAIEIAARLGVPVTEFPGAHNGMRTETKEFAEQLIGVLGG